jgi:hypothetical protein
MKKIILSFIVVIGLTTACKKNYSCTCSNPTSTGYAANSTIVKAKSYQTDAQTWCSGFQTMPNVPPQTTCTLSN